MKHYLCVLWLSLASLFIPCLATGQAPPASTTAGGESQLVTDFTNDIPPTDGSYPNACFTLRFQSIRPLPGGQAGGDVYVQLFRANGQWQTRGHTAAADYNQRSENSVSIIEATWDGSSLKGKLRVTIKPDAPRPRVAGFPTPADEFTIDFSVDRKAEEYLPWQADPLAFMPPWRRDEPVYGGELLTGKFTAVRASATTQSATTQPATTKPANPEAANPEAANPESVTTQGTLTGAVQPTETDTHFGTRGNMVITPADGGGMSVLARLAPKRVASPSRAVAARRFGGKQDWSAWDALRVTVRSAARRDDAAVAIALRTDDGRWQQVTSAALLLGNESSFTIPLADFNLDLKNVSGIAFGVDNAEAVGDVSFIVRKAELVRLNQPKPPVAAFSRITIDPTTSWSMNGATVVPKGLFGFHDVGETKSRAPAAGEPSAVEYLKIIRPGHLRPLTHVGMGGTKPLSDEAVRDRMSNRPAKREGAFLSRARAAEAVDEVVWTHTADLWARPAWMDEPMERIVSGAEAFYRNLAADAYVPGDEDNVMRLFEVLNEPFMWARHTNMGKLNPANKKAWVDPTQYGYIPAKLGADVWSSIFLAAVKGAKSVNPHVKLGGPSCPEFGMDDFNMFETYVAPILDRCHAQLDFLTEHHYGGNPRIFAAGYEVVTAWCDVRYNRRIPIYVTETNDLGASSAGKASYNIEDILTTIRYSPDKAKGRALHALWDGYLRDEGELHAYTLLAPLRGTLITAGADDDDITTVASSPQDGTLVVVAHNRAYVAKKIELAGVGEMPLQESMLLLASSAGPELEVKDTEGQKIGPTSAGKTRLVPIEKSPDGKYILPPRSAIRWTFRQADYRPAKTKPVEQHFMDILLAHVKPDHAASAKIVWRPKAPERMTAARLRLMTRDVDRDEAVIVINGKEIPLPRTTSNEGQVMIQELPIDPALLSGTPTIEFRCTNPSRQNGFKVYAASVCVEQ